MKVDIYDIIEGFLYTDMHIWVKIIDNRHALTGITDYAAKSIHNVVFVKLPSVGTVWKRMDALGSLESTKAIVDIYSPLSGRITRINEELSTRPQLLKQSPYEEGWIIELDPTNLDDERSQLLSAEEYSELIRRRIYLLYGKKV